MLRQGIEMIDLISQCSDIAPPSKPRVSCLPPVDEGLSPPIPEYSRSIAARNYRLEMPSEQITENEVFAWRAVAPASFAHQSHLTTLFHHVDLEQKDPGCEVTAGFSGIPRLRFNCDREMTNSMCRLRPERGRLFHAHRSMSGS